MVLESTSTNAQEELAALKSSGSRYDPADHEVNLEAIRSQAISIGEVGVNLTPFQKDLILKKLNFDSLDTLEDLPVAVIFMIEKIQNIQVNDAVDILKETLLIHNGDPNFPLEDYDFIQKLLENSGQPVVHSIDVALNEIETEKIQTPPVEDAEKTARIDASSLSDQEASASRKIDTHKIVDWDLQIRLEAAVISYWSPYPEVRAVTDPFDDPSIPCETFRAYLCALIWTVIGSFVNEFFYHRNPPISLETSVIQLFLYPSGKLCEYIFPKWGFTIPLPYMDNIEVELNPGPWSSKEQQFASIFYAVSAVTPYVDSNIYVQKLKVFYGDTWVTFGFQVLLILSTQFIGFGLAGLLRKFTIYPVKAMWPTILPTLALNRALVNPERKENINGWTISRYRFFFITTAASFVYFWFPDFIFQALSTFNWMCWIKPDNFNLANITGSGIGMGLNPITTFDWNVINFNYALTVPWFSQFNQYIGSIIGFFAIIAVYYSNKWWTAYLPMNSNYLFTNTGEYYDTSQVIGANNDLDEDLYKAYGPAYFSAANIVVYAGFFMLYLFSFFYQIIIDWRGMYASMKDLIKGFKDFKKPIYENFTDPHSRMMSKYKEVPDWVYLVVLLISFVLGILCVELFPTQTPVWGIVFAVVLNFVFLVPITSLFATTGFQFGLNVLVEICVGYMFPGKYLPLITLKAFGYNTGGQSLALIEDMKSAHYVKIPPRALFRGQMISTFVCAFMTLATIGFEIGGGVKDLCDPDQSNGFSCPQEVIYYSSSIQYGLIGPRRFFDQEYPILRYCFLIGFLLVPFAVAFKWYGPRKLAAGFQPSAMIGGILIYAPYNLAYYTPGLYASFAFMYYIKKKYTTWWEKYNYVLSGALQAGVAFSAIIIFFSVQYTNVDLSWWGNNVPYAGVDGGSGQQSLKNVTVDLAEGYFGLKWGTFD
ncbi:oligopeptide transporter 2 [[Candida] railenensis]|uniref:Oligopeptide transporter 2 n=1 Tax=[Candida] railenensis TaxID=45579 RepID=A0A9P0QTI1_9ASCO|nr:oligopeptide transporter 2 [[Candida] railenensis]